jgi:hypothetical protein
MADVKAAPAKREGTVELEDPVEDISDPGETGGVRAVSRDVARQGVQEHVRREKQMRRKHAEMKKRRALRRREKQRASDHELHEARHRSRAGGPREPAGPEYGRKHGEGAAEAVARQAEAAPVHGNPTMDPVTTVWDVALMAGYGDGAGYETLQGIDDYVLGNKDAMQEARVSSKTEGGPLDLDPYESIYSDDAGFGDVNTSLEEGEGIGGVDWRRECRCDPSENPLRGGR